MMRCAWLCCAGCKSNVAKQNNAEILDGIRDGHKQCAVNGGTTDLSQPTKAVLVESEGDDATGQIGGSTSNHVQP